MDKTSEKLTKDPKRVEAGLPIQALKLPALLKMQAMKLPAPTTPPPQNQMILMSMALVYLLSLSLVLVYFLHITLLRVKMKNKINHQNDVICFSKNIYNE